MALVYVNISVVEGVGAVGRMRLAQPGGQWGVVLPGPRDRLARRLLGDDEQAAVWWLGAHGGAGESTLEELFCGSRAADHSWPLAAANVAPTRVVLVARTHARGLRAAQSAIREWAGADARVLLLGLVLIADAPGRLPHGLRQLSDLIAGGVPAVWSLPWIEAWRVGEPPAPHNAPKMVRPATAAVLATPRERQARPLVGAALSACWGVGFGAVNVTHALAEAGLAPMRHYLIILDELWRALIAGRGMVDRTNSLTRARTPSKNRSVVSNSTGVVPARLRQESS
jgi:hypothetical protein